MKKKMAVLMAFVLLMTFAQNLVILNAKTNNYLTKDYLTPLDVTMLSDSPRIPSSNSVPVNTTAGWEQISGYRNRTITSWDSTIKYVMRAPELVIDFEHDIAMDTEFEIELTNLIWFFRSAEEDIESLSEYGGGIEKLLPSSYNTEKGIFKPNSTTGTGGTYYRYGLDDEVSYELTIDDTNNQRAKIKITDFAQFDQVLRIPLITRLDYYASARVEVIAKSGTGISSGLYTVFSVANNPNPPTLKKPTVTTVTNPQSGIDEFPVFEIVITENLEASLESGTFLLTAPEGFKFVPDVDNSLMKTITNKTLDLQDGEGNYIINISVNGGIEWSKGKNKTGDGERGRDYTIYYRNPAGNADASKLLVEIKELKKSSKSNYGSIIITGLKIVVDDSAPYGDVLVKIEPQYSMENLTKEEFLAGGKYDISMNGVDAFNIETMSVYELIKTPEFKAKSYILPFGGGLQPKATITRGLLCDMLYNLFADKDREYSHEFTDVSGHRYEKAIAFCAEKGFISGFGDGTFYPNGYIKRGDFSIILANILKLNEEVNLDYPEKDHYAYDAMVQLVNKGIMVGYEDGELKPEKLLNKHEAVILINRAFDRGSLFIPNGKTYDDLYITDWYYGHMMNAACGFYDINKK